MSNRSIRITVEAGSDPRLFSSDFKVPFKIFANDVKIFEWEPGKIVLDPEHVKTMWRSGERMQNDQNRG